MKRTVIIIDHEDDFDVNDASDAVGELVGVDDVTVAEELIVAAVGNPFEGMSVAGPFLDGDEAEEHGESSGSDADWWVVTVNQTKR